MAQQRGHSKFLVVHIELCGGYSFSHVKKSVRACVLAFCVLCVIQRLLSAEAHAEAVRRLGQHAPRRARSAARSMHSSVK